MKRIQNIHNFFLKKGKMSGHVQVEGHNADILAFWSYLLSKALD